MDAFHRPEVHVVLARADLRAQQAGQVEGAARAPAREALHLHLHIEEAAAAVARQHVELDGFPGDVLGQDAGVEHLQHLYRRLALAHGADQCGQQLGAVGEQALEDVVVLGVEQFHAGHCRQAGHG